MTDEMMAAAAAAGIADEVLASLDASEKVLPWRQRAANNLDRMASHGARGAAEMEESVQTLEASGIAPVMTRGTVLRQRTASSVKDAFSGRIGHVIIECHGYYTVLPKAHDEWREVQKAAFKAGKAAPAYPAISDDEVRETIEANQLGLLMERGADLTIFSPRASAMAPHVGDQSVAVPWAQACNIDMATTIAELTRRVTELGFFGCHLNPDPSGGHFSHAPPTDPFWFPLYEIMCDLDVPAMIHVSGSYDPAMHATGGYYIAAGTIAFMQLLDGDLFARFPNLRFIIPHGGGAVPWHWGRYRGLADMLGKSDLWNHLMNNVFFDTCVYHQIGVNLPAEVVDRKNILFGSEMVGAVRGIDRTTGYYFDDTKRYVDAPDISDAERHAIFEGNAGRVYPRLDAQFAERRL